MPLTDAEELELLELERQRGLELDKQMSTAKPKPQFSTLAEAQDAMRKAQYDVYMNKEIANNPVMPYVMALGKSAVETVPYLAGGAVSAGMLGKAAPTIANLAKAGAAGGAVTGGLSALGNNPQTLQQAAGDIAKGSALGATTGAVGGAAVGGILKGATSLADAARMLPTRLSDTKSVKFANEMRNAFLQAKENVVKKFGKGLDDLTNANPDKKIDLFNNNNIQNILTDPNLPPEAKNIFSRTPILRDILSGNRSPEITLKESQDIINYIQTKVPSNIKASHLDIPEMLSELRVAQSQSFKEMDKLRSEYAKIAQPFSQVKNKFKLDNLLQSIDKGFDGPVGREAVKELFKDNPKVLSKLGGYKNAGMIIKGALGAATGGGLLVGGKAVYDKVRQ